jgi:hypothetical protein
MIARRLTAQPNFGAGFVRLADDVLDHPFHRLVLFVEELRRLPDFRQGGLVLLSARRRKLPNPAGALRGVDVYIGDGATLRRSMVRVKDGTLIGHAAIATQLEWCAKAQLHQAIFTHCGSAIVRGNGRFLAAIVRGLGRKHDVDARIARDGDRLLFAEADRRKGAPWNATAP